MDELRLCKALIIAQQIRLQQLEAAVADQKKQIDALRVVAYECNWCGCVCSSGGLVCTSCRDVCCSQCIDEALIMCQRCDAWLCMADCSVLCNDCGAEYCEECVHNHSCTE